MKNLLVICSLIALLLSTSSCDKHEDVIIPPPPPECELVSVKKVSVDCPDQVGGNIVVRFEVKFKCDDLPQIGISVTDYGHDVDVSDPIDEDVTGDFVTLTYESVIDPYVGATTATVSYSVSFNGEEKSITVSCDLPDPPQECFVEQIVLTEKQCPTQAGENIEVSFDVVYDCSTVPTLNLSIDANGHTVTYTQSQPTQVNGKWVRHVNSTISPSVTTGYVEVGYTVTFGNSSKQISVSCNLPDPPDECELYDLKIVNEKWLSETQVELSLEVWFENCNLVPDFNVVGTTNADFTTEHTGSYTQGGYNIYKVKSIVTIPQCQTSVFVHYSVTYENITRVAPFEAQLCQFKEASGKGGQYPYQGDPNKAVVVFDIVFTGCHSDPLYNVAIDDDDIANGEISLEVLSVTNSGDHTIFHMYSEIKSTSSLYNKWISYDISYCGEGVMLKFDF